MSKLEKMPLALKREHPTLKNMKFLNFFYFCGSLLPPGSGTTDQIESGSATLFETIHNYTYMRRSFARYI
jgi:hypothetical protein